MVTARGRGRRPLAQRDFDGDVSEVGRPIRVICEPSGFAIYYYAHRCIITQMVFGPDSRWQLYRLLGEPLRLRILTLAGVEELSVGELAEALSESQPNVSRHAAHLRQAGLLVDRREGTRTFVRVADSVRPDPVVVDALHAGRRLCEADGSLARVEEVIAARDAMTREFFSRPARARPEPLTAELPACLYALGTLIDGRELAVDVGTGEGAWLEVLAPVFRRVIAVDRSAAQLEQARDRLAARGYENVELLQDEADGPRVRQAVARGADLVVCSRMLHHARRPRETVRRLGELLRPGGCLVVVDYERHQDERFSEQQADVWLGFEPPELHGFAASAGLVPGDVRSIPPPYVPPGVDGHLKWHLLTARRPLAPSPAPSHP